mmetsp:Transcript_37902/g.33921  ORF Transcript_37902/g.33921 Transcript_37902/m.33921 type:complete len:105 (+) Transcript_37902:71-385(+)
MGQLYLDYLDGDNIYICAKCKAHLTNYNYLLSKAFRGRGGKAYLFTKVVNIESGPKEERLLLSGIHIVSDLHCKNCKTVVGWKYDFAYEESQKYKENKFILEKV